MQTRHVARNRWLVLGLGLVALIASTAPAQLSFEAIQQNQPAGDASAPAVKVSAVLTPPEGDRPAELSITADIGPGWHIYSTTQKSGGPIPTKIALAKSDRFELAGRFEALSTLLEIDALEDGDDEGHSVQ